MRHLPSRDAGGKGNDATPMSAARLAAEAAFAAPLFSAPPASAPAQVTVRRARGPGLATAVADDVDTSSAGPSDSSTAKGPRVFRIDAAPSAVTLVADDLPTPTAWQGDDAVVSRPTSRLRRTATDKRPGPVLHVVHTLPSRQVTSLQPLGALTTQLALLEPVLADIQHAQAFQFVDNSQASEWQRLGRVADDAIALCVVVRLTSAGQALERRVNHGAACSGRPPSGAVRARCITLHTHAAAQVLRQGSFQAHLKSLAQL
jgi:hypothetical protein